MAKKKKFMDKYSTGIIASSIILLCVLGFYSHYSFTEEYVPLEDFLESPSDYEGELFKYTGKTFISEGKLYIRYAGELVEIKADVSKLREARFGYSTIVAGLHSEGYMELLNYYPHDYQFMKYILSGLAILIWLWMFSKEWKIQDWKFRLKGGRNS